jgi:DNA polymerase-4
MDAFYVNVHRLEHPEDVGIPLVVGGRPEQRGVVSSASYEARRFGVRSAMPTSQALRLCPRLKIVPANWPRIREMSQQVMAVLEGYGLLEKMSVDEAYVDLSQWTDPRPLAGDVQAKVKTETALPASVGLATCKLVAKVASDFEKPEGCTIVLPGKEAAFLAPLSTRMIWGIGPRTAERLAQIGIATCGQLATADVTLLQRYFGRQAESLIRHAQGTDDREVRPDRGPAKSISQEWTFSQDVTESERLREQLREMSAEVARSLQKRNLLAHTVRVKLRWSDFTTFTRQRSLEIGTAEEATIYHHAVALWQENWPPGRPVRLIGVGVSNLRQREEKQLGFDFG